MDLKLYHNSQKLLKVLKGTDFSTVGNSTLLNDHRLTHMLYAGLMRYDPPKKKTINSIVNQHDDIVKVMLSRGMNHNTPLKKI